MAQVTTASVASRENKLRKWRAALGEFLQSGTATKVLFVGDSKDMGAGAGDINVYTGGAAPLRRTAVLAALMTPAGVRSSDQNICGGNNLSNAAVYSAYDARVAFGSGWSLATTTVGNVIGGKAFQTSTIGGNLSFSPEGTVDTVDIIYCRASAAGTFTVSDGATLRDTVDANGFGLVVRRSVALDSRGTGKTINIALSSGAAVFILAIIATDSQNPAVELLNAGAYGWMTTEWLGAASPWSPLNAVGAYAPHLTFIRLGANDQNNASGLAPATFKSNTQALITAAQASGDVVLINESYGSGNYQRFKSEYRTALLELAASNDCLFHDEAARMNYDETPTWFSDAVHEKAFAHADGARSLLPYLLPHLMS